MAEHSFDIGGEFSVRSNGVTPTPVAALEQPLTEVEELVLLAEGQEVPSGARLDVARGVFITSNGNELELSDKLISSLYLERLAQAGKPQIPLVEVTLVGNRKQLEAFPGHEGYRALLAEWESESRVRSLKYIFTVGVKVQPPPAFIEENRTFFPGATELDMKYLYIASLLPDSDIDALSEAIMGRTLPTTKGVEQVSNFTASQ